MTKRIFIIMLIGLSLIAMSLVFYAKVYKNRLILPSWNNSLLAWQENKLDFGITRITLLGGHGDSINGPISNFGAKFHLEIKNNDTSKSYSGPLNLASISNGIDYYSSPNNNLEIKPNETVERDVLFQGRGRPKTLIFTTGGKSNIIFSIDVPDGDIGGVDIKIINLNPKQSSFKDSDTKHTKPKAIIASGDAVFARNLNDDRNLMGDSHNVFVGKVVKESKSEGWNTEFEVSVIKNVKGNLMGNVLVHVTGGYRSEVFYVEGGSTWLEPGSTYLLATRFDGAGAYHLISFPASWKLLSGDQNLTDGQLSSLADNDSRVRQLEKAYTQEVPLPVDLANNNTLNSYQSLTEAQKYALPYYTGSYNPNPPAPTSTATSTRN